MGKIVFNNNTIEELSANPIINPNTTPPVGALGTNTSTGALYLRQGGTPDWARVRRGVQRFEDFNFASAGSTSNTYSVIISSANGGAGSIDTTTSDNLYSGAALLTTGTNIFAAGSCQLDFFNGQNEIVLGGGDFNMDMRFKIPTLSTSGVPFQVGIGMGDGANANNGIFLFYTHGTNGGRFQCYAINNSTATVTDSGVTVVGDAWYKFRVEIPEAVNVAYLFINEVLVATITTNLPINNPMRYLALIQKLASGSTSRLLVVDYVGWRFDR